MGWPDKVTGYVEVKDGPKCGNCRYLHPPDNLCTLPQVGKQVSPFNGCCKWFDDGSGQDGIEPPPAPTINEQLGRMMNLPGTGRR